MRAQQANYTLVVTDPAEGKQVVGGRWVYSVKGDPERPIYKDRYVAKGFSQIRGIDYTENFSPKARMETVRTVMQIAVDQNLTLHQMDVKSAYLHADISEEVYMCQPKGYELEGKVWRLRKSLYGLKQSGRNWHNLLHDYLIELNFKQSSADPCLYINRSGREVIILLVWVDGIILG